MFYAVCDEHRLVSIYIPRYFLVSRSLFRVVSNVFESRSAGLYTKSDIRPPYLIHYFSINCYKYIYRLSDN
jgi:hypothetical protein